MNSRRANLPSHVAVGRTVGNDMVWWWTICEYYRAAMFGLGFNLGDFGAIRSM